MFIKYCNYAMNLIIVALLAIVYVKCEPQVTGRCGRPALPPHASKWLITPERSRFDNTEKVIIVCKKGEFVHHNQQVVCKNGRWIGRHPRCAKLIKAEVTQLDVSECDSSQRVNLVSERLNQSPDGPTDYGPLPANAFHALRVPLNQSVSAKGYNCYAFDIRFDTRVQIWFLTVDIWYKDNEDKSNTILEMNPIVSKYRTCRLQVAKSHEMGNDTVMGYYFFCDLNNDTLLQKEDSEPMNTMTLNVKTNFTEEVGLEALFIGSIYKDKMGSMEKPDCGQIETQNLGIDVQEETNHMYISCNDSFVDLTGKDIKLRSTSGNPKHKFICNQNGLWVGQWPKCMPKTTCPKDETSNADSSVIIEEVGNTYFFNETEWYAINDSYIRYTCVHESDIMVGKNIRLCMKSGKWNSNAPYCTRTALSGLAIAGILFAVLIIFVAIVLFVFRIYSKRVKHELRETRNELQESARKRFSEEFYADIKEDNFYDNTEEDQKSPCYEDVNCYETVPEPPRYEMGPSPGGRHQPEYLDMFAIK